jgi:hypothetical protein
MRDSEERRNAYGNLFRDAAIGSAPWSGVTQEVL